MDPEQPNPVEGTQEYKAWATTGAAMRLEEEGDLVECGSYSPYTGIDGVVERYGVNRILPSALHAMVSTALTAVRRPGSDVAYDPEDIERLLGHSPQTRDTHYVMAEHDGELPTLDAIDYHQWGGVPYHSPLAGGFVGLPVPLTAPQ